MRNHMPETSQTTYGSTMISIGQEVSQRPQTYGYFVSLPPSSMPEPNSIHLRHFYQSYSAIELKEMLLSPTSLTESQTS